MKDTRVFITGAGMVSSIGMNLAEIWNSLSSKESGIGKLKYLNTRHNDLYAAEVKKTNKELLSIAGISNPVLEKSRTSLLAFIAAKQAVKGHESLFANNPKAAVISATTVGGINISEVYYENLLKNSIDKEYIPGFESHFSTNLIASELGVRKFVTTINTACSSSANAIMLGARLIRQKIVDVALVGGADALSRYTLNGFRTLDILDSVPCRPFDKNRQGLNLGEGAAFLVLQSEESFAGKEILGEVSGWGNANDAFHPTATSPEGTGAYLAMMKALECADLSPENIDYINAHGTGTDINDLSEGIAIERLFNAKFPLISSTKSYTGHTLGAAGSIEAVISLLAMNKNWLPPNLNFQNKIDELKFHPLVEAESGISVNHVMSNSFGFGGNSTSLIFSKVTRV